MQADVAVVGGGVVGLSAARALARRGSRVVLVDDRPLLNAFNASNDESKVFRFAYRGDRENVERARRALVGWREIERDSGRRILHDTGLLVFPGSFASESAETLRAMGEECRDVDAQSARLLAPDMRGHEGGVVDPRGGWLDPHKALFALHEDIRLHGGRTLRGPRVDRVEPGALRLSDGTRLEAGAIVVAAGFRAPALLPELSGKITVTRQVELFFRATPELRDHPTFADFDGGFYGFPPRGGAVKIADHEKGPVVTEFVERPPAADAEVARGRAWLAKRIPALAEAPLARSRVCLYDNAPDDRFILGPSRELPRVVVAAGMSGHAFKFGPALGEELADMVGRL